MNGETNFKNSIAFVYQMRRFFYDQFGIVLFFIIDQKTIYQKVRKVEFHKQ